MLGVLTPWFPERMRVVGRRELLGAEDAGFGEEPLEPLVVVWGTIEQIGEAGPLPGSRANRVRPARTRSASATAASTTKSVSVAFALVAACRDGLVSLGRDAKVPALVLWHALTMHMPSLSLLTRSALGSS